MATEKISTSIIADDAVTGDKIENNPTVAGNLTVGGNVVIPDGGNIGSSSDTDAISIASNGKPTFSAGIANTGTIDAGTFNGLLGELAQLKVYTHSHTTDFYDGGIGVFAFGTSMTIPSSANTNGSKFLIFVGGGRWSTGSTTIKCRANVRVKEGSDFSGSTEGEAGTPIIQTAINGIDPGAIGTFAIVSYTNDSGSSQTAYVRSAADIVDAAPQNPSWNAGGDDGVIGLIAVKIQ